MKLLQKIPGGLLLIAILAITAFLLWASTPLGPMPLASEKLMSSDLVRVKTTPWLEFKPADRAPVTGFIFYPGGRVDYRSYAPLGYELAKDGFLVIIPPMTLNLAVFSPEKAAAVQKSFPEIATWVIGGHSLGGAMAARYAFNHPDEVQGLVLLAAYPARSDDLSRQDIRVISVYGSEDGLATSDKIDQSRQLLPADTGYIEIEGGNHAQMGWYGTQPGDGEAVISREDQQNQVTSAIIDFLYTISAKR